MQTLPNRLAMKATRHACSWYRPTHISTVKQQSFRGFVFFSDVTPCSVVGSHRRFGGKYRPYETTTLKGAAVCFSKALATPSHNLMTTWTHHREASISTAWLKLFVTFLSPYALILTQCQENWCSHQCSFFSFQHVCTSPHFIHWHNLWTDILRDFRLSSPCRWGLPFFWDVMERRLTAGHRSFGTAYRSHLQDWNERLPRNIPEERRLAVISLKVFLDIPSIKKPRDHRYKIPPGCSSLSVRLVTTLTSYSS